MKELAVKGVGLVITTVPVLAAALLTAGPAAAGEPANDPPDRPTGLTGTVSHDAATLSSRDGPQDGSITGCQALRRQRGVDGQGDFQVHAAGPAATLRTGG